MRRSLFISLHLTAAIGRLDAQPPAILQNGLFNSASHMAGSLPGAALAPGSRFAIRGVRLGTDVRTTIVTVQSGGRGMTARLLAVSASEVEGILPVTLMPGEATATVTRGGESSQAFAFRVAPMAVGLFTANRLGWGPADMAKPTGAKPSLAPGVVARLRATGIGTGLRLRLFVGGRPSPTVSATSKSNQPGMDEIAFRVPDGVEGCYVPVYAQTPEGLVSNIVTLPIMRGGGACAPPEGWPTPGLQSALVLLSRFSLLLETRPGDWEAHDQEYIEASFAAGSGSPLVAPIHLLPPTGTCTGSAGVYQSGGGFAELAGLGFEASGARGLDAGEEIAVASAGGKLNLVAGPEGFYRARISKRSTKPFLLPGELQISSQGGSAVGPFAATVRAASPLTWKNREQLAVVDRRKGLTVEWSNADPRRPVLIVAIGVDRLSTAAYACLCVAAAGTGNFTIPAAMLANLPATSSEAGLPHGLLLLTQSTSGGYAQFQARGIGSGTVMYLTGSGRSVSFR
ncbi:MAG: hypothetical protein ABI806_18045 [Candidatus Solibacter sp.]